MAQFEQAGHPDCNDYPTLPDQGGSSYHQEFWRRGGKDGCQDAVDQLLSDSSDRRTTLFAIRLIAQYSFATRKSG